MFLGHFNIEYGVSVKWNSTKEVDTRVRQTSRCVKGRKHPYCKIPRKSQKLPIIDETIVPSNTPVAIIAFRLIPQFGIRRFLFLWVIFTDREVTNGKKMSTQETA